MFVPSGLSRGAIITEPTKEGYNVGVIHIDTGGFLPMCGHGTLALGKALVDLGMVEKKKPETKIVIDTAAGSISVNVKVENVHSTAVLRSYRSKISFHL